MTTAQPYAYLIPEGDSLRYRIFVVYGLHHRKWCVAADEINSGVWLTKDGHWVSMGRNSDRDEEDYEQVLFDTEDEAIAAAVKKSDEGPDGFALYYYPNMETYREMTGKARRGGDPA